MEADFSFKSLDVGEGSQINQFDLPSLPSRDEAIKFLGNNKILAVGLAFAAVVVTAGIAFAFAAQTALSIALSPIALVVGLVALPIILSEKIERECDETTTRCLRNSLGSNGEGCREVERSESELTESLDDESKLSGTQLLALSTKQLKDVVEEEKNNPDNTKISDKYDVSFNPSIKEIELEGVKYNISQQLILDVPRTWFEIDEKIGRSQEWAAEPAQNEKYVKKFLKSYFGDLSKKGLNSDGFQSIINMCSQATAVEMFNFFSEKVVDIINEKHQKQLMPTEWKELDSSSSETEVLKSKTKISINTEDKIFTISKDFGFHSGTKYIIGPIAVSVTYKIDSDHMKYLSINVEIPEELEVIDTEKYENPVVV